MNLQQALKEFDIKANASDEEIKKKYKELSKKFHPDRNQEQGAEDKFKKINAAHDVLKKRNDQPDQSFSFSGFNVQQIVLENIEVKTKITFIESVLGTKKSISYDRQSKCNDCNGAGKKIENNGCLDCKGTGIKTTFDQRSVFRSTCTKCYGKQKTSQCISCNAQGQVFTKVNISVTIPPGVQDGNVLRIQGMGNYVVNFMMEHSTDVHLSINVDKHQTLFINENDVCFNCKLTLQEAVRGCSKKVDTIKGEQEITIPKLSKNKEEILLPKLGVAGIGNQKIILNVSYPHNIQELLKD